MSALSIIESMLSIIEFELSIIESMIIKLSFLFYWLVCPIWFIQELKKERVVKDKSEKHHTKTYIESIKYECTTIKERNTWIECGEVLKPLFKLL